MPLPFPSLHRFSSWILLILLLSRTLTAEADQPGQVDLGFAPPPTFQQWFPFLSVADGRLYVSGFAPDQWIHRLNEDGSVDSSWAPKSPIASSVVRVQAGPSGGLLFQTMQGQAIREQRDGSFSRLSSGLLDISPSLFPLTDGAVLFKRTTGFFRQNALGIEDPNYRANSTLDSVWFANPGGSSLIGDGARSTFATLDSQGRIIVAGNFATVGGVPRLGLARLLADGKTDPTWDPSASLGIGITNAADPQFLTNLPVPPSDRYLTVRPKSVTLGTNDSVLVSLEYLSPVGVRDERLSVISSNGTVTHTFADSDATLVRLVQPDGRIILAGSIRTWKGAPVSGVIRVEPDGTLDPSFQVSLDPPGSLVAAAALDDQGRLYLSGDFQSINGVQRPRLARLIAFKPNPAAPQMEVRHTQPRIGSNELLHLTARVTGSPPPELQWYRNGQPLPGETYPGLRLPITNATDLGEFRLVAQNSEGTQELSFGQIELGIRSPQPGLSWVRFSGPLGDLGQVTQILPLSDGRILCSLEAPRLGETYPLIACFKPDGTLDRTFGTDGVVKGTGLVELLQVSTTGTILVAGYFESWAGTPAWGLVELSTSGQRLSRAFPRLDPPSVTAVLELPEGRWLIAGRFTQLDSRPAFRLARLRADLSWDTSFDASSLFIPYQLVNTLALDAQGRVLAGGAQFSSGGSLTNPIPLGLVRLQENGTADPAFQRSQDPVYSIHLEPDGTWLTGFPYRRWNSKGELVKAFPFDLNYFLFGSTDHRSARLPDGRWIHPIRSRANSGDKLTRWRPDGSFDELFEDRFSTNRFPTQITALSALPDGSFLVGVQGASVTALERLLPDSDQQLSAPSVAGTEFQAGLFTQPSRDYVIRHRASLNGTPQTPSPVLRGDGYLTPFSAPLDAVEGYWEVLSEPRGASVAAEGTRR